MKRPTLNGSLERAAHRLRISAQATVGAAFLPYLRRHLRRAHSLLNSELSDFSLALVNDKRMSELHLKFMNIAGPTDVLTFPLDVDALGRAIAGEVVICVSEARRRATEHGVDVRDELLLYALHGMLHLAGFDDRTARGFARMHRMEDEILTRLGVGAVFKPAAKPTRPPTARRGGR